MPHPASGQSTSTPAMPPPPAPTSGGQRPAAVSSTVGYATAQQFSPQQVAPTAQPAAAVLDLPLQSGLRLSSVGKKFLAYVLEMFLVTVTFGIGWLIWGAVVAAKGQTPARQLLGMRVVGVHDGRPLSWAQMVFMRGLVGAFIQGVATSFTLGIMLLMPVWDRRNQTVADKVSASIVLDDVHGYYA